MAIYAHICDHIYIYIERESDITKYDRLHPKRCVLDVWTVFRAPEALCGYVAAACGALAPSAKHAHGCLEHVACGFNQFSSI